MAQPVIKLEKLTLLESAKLFLPHSLSIALDAGGHKGNFLIALFGTSPKTCLVNLDIDKRVLLRGHKRIDLHLQADCANIPIKDKAIDFLACSAVLEHIRYPRKAIAEFSRVLRIGGVLALDTLSKNIFRSTYYRLRRLMTNRPHDLFDVSDHNLEEFLGELGDERWFYHFHEGFALAQLTKLFAEYGLQIVHIESVFPRFFIRYLPFGQHIGIAPMRRINYLARLDKTTMFFVGEIILIAKKNRDLLTRSSCVCTTF